MNYQTETQLAKEFFDKCLSTLTKKANDYAKDTDVFSNFKKIALVCDVPTEKTFLMFLTVKIARIVELLDKEAKNESTEDSLMDLANYSCLMSMFLKENKDGSK